jgi:hypothetical protein
MFDFKDKVVMLYESPMGTRVFDCPSEEAAEEQAFLLIKEEYSSFEFGSLDEALHTQGIEAKVRIFVKTVVEKCIELDDINKDDPWMYN